MDGLSSLVISWHPSPCGRRDCRPLPIRPIPLGSSGQTGPRPTPVAGGPDWTNGVDEGIMSRSSAFLQKPLTPEALASKVRETLNRPRQRAA